MGEISPELLCGCVGECAFGEKAGEPVRDERREVGGSRRSRRSRREKSSDKGCGESEEELELDERARSSPVCTREVVSAWSRSES